MTVYRQYRSNTFRELLGQEGVTTLLQNALGKERLAHAYLFSGPRGTGKTSTARLLARAATCLEPLIGKNDSGNTTFEACGKCMSCLSQIENRASDIIEIDAASNRGIEDIRELREQASYPAVQLKYKIYIIDEVHMLTTEAFNALLKTLEEPAKNTIFILATTELQKVPATIRSRCQLVRFHSASVGAIVKKLKHITKSEKWEVEAEALTLIAEHAKGGFRDAETTLEQLATQYQPLTADNVHTTLGLVSGDVVTTLLNALLTRNTSEVVRTLEIVATGVSRADQLTMQLITLIRAKLIEPKADIPQLTFALSQLLEAYVLHRSSPVPFLPLEIACLTIATEGTVAAPHRVQTPSTPSIPIQHHVGIAEAPVTKRVIPPTPIPQPTQHSAPVVVQAQPLLRSDVPVVELRQNAITDIRLAWKEMIIDIGKHNAPLCQMLRETIFYSAEGNDITIHVRFKFHVEKLSEKKNKIRIEQLLHELTHTSWDVHYELSENMPKRTQSKQINANTGADAAAVFGA